MLAIGVQLLSACSLAWLQPLPLVPRSARGLTSARLLAILTWKMGSLLFNQPYLFWNPSFY